MKKFILPLIVAPSLLFVSCDDKKTVKFEDLPQQAQVLITTNWSNINVVHVEQEGIFSSTYDVKMSNGDEIGFDGDGIWDKIDCNMNQVPVGLVPAAITTDLSTRYPGSIITSIEKEGKHYEVDILLEGGVVDLDLEYGLDGGFLRVD